MIATISISAGRRRWRSPQTATVKSPSARGRPASTSNTPVLSVGFNWDGSDKGDQVLGDGSAELLDDGSIESEFAYRNGDQAVLKAKHDTSSTACSSCTNSILPSGPFFQTYQT